ncbi:MAG: nodulation protein NfeD [Candidatus Geothermarchaeales archaeon]
MNKIYLILLLSLLATPIPVLGKNPSRDKVYVIELDMNIDAGAADIVSRGIHLANLESSSAATIIRLNTNGGYLISTQRIVDSIKSSEKLVIVYIGPSGARAFSAGAYIAMAANKIVMAQGTAIGAATPTPPETKTVSALKGWMRSLAEAYGRNVTVAERLVTEGLTLTALEAHRYGVAEAIVIDLNDLLERFDLEDSERVTVSSDLRASIFSFVNNPTVVWLLFIAGFIMLLLGLFHPTIVGEASGVVFIVLALFGLGIIEVSPLVMALLIIGASTIFLELKKGHGALAITGMGISLIGLALIYQGEPFIAPQISEYAMGLIGILIAGSVGFYIHKIREVLKVRKAAHDLQNLVGKFGYAKTDIEPSQSGVVFLASDLWTAVADEEIKAGERVRVIGVDGIKLRVERPSEGGE